jgi:hypothetical protein
MAAIFTTASSHYCTLGGGILHVSLTGSAIFCRVNWATGGGGYILHIASSATTTARDAARVLAAGPTHRISARNKNADTATDLDGSTGQTNGVVFSMCGNVDYTNGLAYEYFQGILDSAATSMATSGTSDSNASAGSHIGARADHGANFLGATIEDLKFFVGLLTATEVYNNHLGFTRAAWDRCRHWWKFNEATSGNVVTATDYGNVGSRINASGVNNPQYTTALYTVPAVIARLGQYGPNGDASTGTTDHTFSFSLVLGNEANRIAWLVVTGHNVNTGLTAAPTLNGVSMTLAETHTAGGVGAFVSTYYMLEANLPAGSANGTSYTVTGTVDSAVASGEVAAWGGYIPDSAQEAPEATGESDGTGTSLTASITTVRASSIIVTAGYNFGSTDDGTPGTDEIELCDFSGSATGPRLYCSSYLAATAATYTPGWTALTTATQKIVVAVSFAKFYVSSTAAASLAGFTGAATVTETIPGTGAATWAELSAAATVTETIPGTAAATWPEWVCAATADASGSPPAVSGTVAASWPELACSATVGQTIDCTAAATWAGFTASASCLLAVPVTSTVAASWPGWTAAISADSDDGIPDEVAGRHRGRRRYRGTGSW